MTETTTNTGKTRAYYTALIKMPSSILPIPFDQRMQKRWIYANKYGYRKQKEDNQAMETLYKNILARVKELTTQPPTHPVFERNYRNDNNENAFMMHAYLSNSFYFLLECDLTSNYIIEFGFNSCPFAEEVMILFKPHIYSGRLNEELFINDFDEFYERTLLVQDQKYISY